MIVKFMILLDDEEKYYYDTNPGIAASELSEVRGTLPKEELLEFEKYSNLQFEFEYNDNSTFRDLAKVLFQKIGFNEEIAFDWKDSSTLYVLEDDYFIRIENSDYNFEAFITKYGIKETLNLFLVYGSCAGEIWKEDALSYKMRSNENAPHKKPHVHVTYKNDDEAVFELENGERIRGASFSGKISKKVKEKGFLISKEQEQECIEFLQKTNYYRLSAYFLPFRKKDGEFFTGTSFSRIQKIYEFDGLLRGLIFSTIEEIEVHIRTQLAYYVAHKFGALGYLSTKMFSNNHNKEIFGRGKGRIVYHILHKAGGKPTVKNDTDLYIDFLSTNVQNRKQGIATKMLDFACGLPVYKECYLDVLSKNDSAARLYQKLGFVVYKKAFNIFTFMQGLGHPILMKKRMH